jgi:hypothetical protein
MDTKVHERILRFLCLFVSISGLFFVYGRAASAQSLNARDGSDAPPRLAIIQAMWGMSGLPSQANEWPPEEKVRLVKEAGFDGFDVVLPKDDAEEKRWVALAEKHGLRLGVLAFPNAPEELTAPLAAAKRMRALYLDTHVGNYFVPEERAREILRAMAEQAKREGVAMMIQTHRGRVTQDLLRTVGHARAIPDLRFCLDLSHYVVAGELGGPFPPEADEAFDVLLRRAPMLDGRISNGEQVQVAVSEDGGDTKKFAALWKRAMVHWLKEARRGDVFVFRVELGPPGYSLVGTDGKELYDRWEQAKLLRRIAEGLWNEAVREAGIGAPHAANGSAPNSP